MHTYKDAIKNTLGAYVLYPGNAPPKIFKQNKPDILPSVGAFPLIPGDNNLNQESNIECLIEKVLKELLN